MRVLVRSVQACLFIVFLCKVTLPLAGIGSMAMRSSMVTDFDPSPVEIVQTQLGVVGAVAHFFDAFQYFAVVVLLDAMWRFYKRVQNFAASRRLKYQ